MAIRFPKVCRQTRSNGSVSLFVNIRVSPYGAPRRYERRYIGTEGTAEAAAALAALQDEFLANNGFIRPKVRTSDKPSVARLCREFMAYVREDYPAGSYEPDRHRRTMALLVAYCGTMTTDGFSLEVLESFRRSLIMKGTCCRREINDRIRRVVRCFKWGARYKLVPISVITELSLLESLRRGKAGSFDNPPVKPVPLEDVLRTLPFLSSVVAAMVRLQVFTGARPGEIRIMRACDVDTVEHNGCWRYYPAHDKTERFRPVGDKKCIPLNRQAQEVLKPFLAVKSGADYLFTPADSMAEIRAARAARRVTKKTPSQKARDDNRRRKPKERLNPCYTASAYRIAVQRAAQAAGVGHWFPYQIRHTTATAIQKALGIEAAQIILGHRSVTTTAIYVEKDHSQAEKIADSLTIF